MQTPESRCHSKIMFARRNIPSTAPLPSVVHIMIYEGIVNSAILFTSINLLIIRCHSSPHPSTARLNKSLTYKVNSKRRYRRGPSASGPPSWGPCERADYPEQSVRRLSTLVSSHSAPPCDPCNCPDICGATVIVGKEGGGTCWKYGSPRIHLHIDGRMALTHDYNRY